MSHDNNWIEKIFENNGAWIASKLGIDVDYFKKMAKSQSPQALFIGCSDSRVPANEITGTEPGELFVHRNIANMVVHTDINMLSVLQYAVEVLEVSHVVVCGHYGCGGVNAAMSDKQFGLIDNWLRNIKDVIRIHYDELKKITDEREKLNRLVELNVREQVFNLSKTTIIQNAWSSGRRLSLHGLVYDIAEGRLKLLDTKEGLPNERMEDIYQFSTD